MYIGNRLFVILATHFAAALLYSSRCMGLALGNPRQSSGATTGVLTLEALQ